MVSLCGNGVIDSAPSYTEQCDDGPITGTAASCCNADCTLRAGGAPCRPMAAACDLPESCTGGSGACAPQPQTTCRAAEKGLLLLKNSDDDSRDKLLWTWIKGASTTGAEFGDPTTSADYALCLYNGTPGILLGALEVAASGSAWRPLGAVGYTYFEPSGAAGGVQKVKLKGSAANRSKVLLKGRGVNLPDLLDGGALTTPVTVQLVNESNGLCWSSSYGQPSDNDASLFESK
jgi:hypothetical protein